LEDVVDRRQHRRARNPEIRVTLVAGNQRAACFAQDLSGGGIRCLASRGLLLLHGERVSVVITCDSVTEPLTLSAQVLRIEQLDAQNDLIALKFLALEDPFQDTIMHVVLRALERHRATAGRTVLVIDDEETIRTALVREMRRLGRPVMVAATPLEAVRALQDETNSIDVALVDLGLGTADGLDIVEHVAAEYPAVRRVVMSGQRIEDLETAVAGGRAHALLRKPWTRATLEMAVGSRAGT
jgi:CheY-like chemotaxis protein